MQKLIPSHPPSQSNAITKEPTMFAIRNLSVLSYAQGFTFWHYRAGDTPLDDMLRPGFFNAATDMFPVGDIMLISGAFGGAQVCVVETGPRVVVALMSATARVPVAMLAAAE
jgi:hypothetical protein